MTEPEKIAHAHKLMVKYVSLILAFTFIGTGLLIYCGTRPRTEIWAKWDVINAPPTLEIIP